MIVSISILITGYLFILYLLLLIFVSFVDYAMSFFFMKYFNDLKPLYAISNIHGLVTMVVFKIHDFILYLITILFSLETL